jgi:hypothetical protein
LDFQFAGVLLRLWTAPPGGCSSIRRSPPEMSAQADAPIPASAEIDWFERFLQDSLDTITVAADLAQLSRSAFIAADDGSYSALAPRLAECGVGPRLVQQRFLPLALSKDLAVRRIIVVDTEDEEAGRKRLLQALREAKFPQSILDTLEIVTFFADVLPAMIAHRPAETLTFGSDPQQPPRCFAIVSTHRERAPRFSAICCIRSDWGTRSSICGLG